MVVLDNSYLAQWFAEVMAASRIRASAASQRSRREGREDNRSRDGKADYAGTTILE